MFGKWALLAVLGQLLLTGAFAASEKVEVIGVDILYECQNNRDIMGYEADCNDLFHYYPGDKKVVDYVKDETEVKIAAYNIYKLGVGETRYKDFTLTAKLINQWDLIAAVEPQPAMAEDRSDNENIANLVAKRKWDLEKARKHYKKPAYLRVLDILRTFDSSWGMLMTAYGQGLNQELVVVYIRGSKVQPIETPYCLKTKQVMQKREAETGKGTLYYKARRTHKKTNVSRWDKKYRASVFPEASTYGCIPTMGEKLDDIISRTPFYASFRASKVDQQEGFEFTIAAVHARFRPPSAQVIKEQMLDAMFDPQGKAVPLFNGILDGKPELVNGKKILKQIWRAKKDGVKLKDLKIKPAKPAQDPAALAAAYALPLDVLEKRISALIDDKEIARYFETYHSLRLLQEIKDGGQPNVMMMGDFNLEIQDELPVDPTTKAKALDYWKVILKALPGAKVFVKEKTSVGQNGWKQPDGLSQNYDHFILDPKTTTQCQTKPGETNAKAFNFMLPESYDENADAMESLAESERYLPVYEDIDKYLMYMDDGVFLASETAAMDKEFKQNSKPLKDKIKEHKAEIKAIKKDKELSKEEKASAIELQKAEIAKLELEIEKVSKAAYATVIKARQDQLEDLDNFELYSPLVEAYEAELATQYNVGKTGRLVALNAQDILNSDGTVKRRAKKKAYSSCAGYDERKGSIAEAYVNDFICRVFYSQFVWTTQYKVFAEVISDHLPVYMSCKMQGNTSKAATKAKDEEPKPATNKH